MNGKKVGGGVGEEGGVRGVGIPFVELKKSKIHI